MSAFSGAYCVSPGVAQNFSPAALAQMQDAFKAFDTDNSGSIDQSELVEALTRVGETVTPAEARVYLSDMDTNADGKVNFEEFATYVLKLRTGASGDEGRRKIAMRKTVAAEVVEGRGGSSHVILDEEKVCMM